MFPDWLPPKLVLNGSSIDNDYKKLYEVFERDFINSPAAVVEGLKVTFRREIDQLTAEGQYIHGFTHLVTHGYGERFIDYERAEKLPWVRAVLDNYTEPEVSAFYLMQSNGERLYLWLTEQDFVVILRNIRSRGKQRSKLLVTAYHLHSSSRRDMQRRQGRSHKIVVT